MTVPYTPHVPTSWRARLVQRVESNVFQRTLIGLILVNAVILGLETSPTVMGLWGPVLIGLDQAILSIFVVEIALRLVAHGPRFFRDPWSVFDFLVISISLVPAAGPFAVLRALRVLRVLRMLTLAPNMRRVVGGLLRAVPGLASVFAVMAIIFYVGAVIATKLFGGHFPDWFGSLGASGYTLFQVMTLESWSMGIARPVIEVFPFAWMFFLVFILISTFTMLNLFIAVIVNAMHSEELAEANVVSQHEQAAATSVKDELAAMRAELVRLRATLEQPYGRLDGGAATKASPGH